MIKRVAILSGLTYPVPPVRGGGPQIVIYNTCLNITDPGIDWYVLGNWEKDLDALEYDRKRIIAIKTIWLDKLVLRIVNLLPYRIKRDWFSEVGDPERLLLNIKIIRELLFLPKDVIVCHESYPLTYLVHLIFPYKKIISYLHNSKIHLDFSELMWKRLVEASTGGIVFGAEAALVDVERTFIQKPVRNWVIYNGVNTLKFNKQQRFLLRKDIRRSFHVLDDEFVFIYCGRIAPIKNLDHLVEAFITLAGQEEKIKLFLVGSAERDDFGDITYEDKLHAMIPRHLRTRVSFVGFFSHEKLPEIYSVADCGVLASSTSETATLFLLECLACGIPVVGTDVGAIPEVVRQGMEGVIIPRSYSQTELMKAMEQMFKKRNQWVERSRDIETYIQNNFSWKRVAEEFTAILNEL